MHCASVLPATACGVAFSKYEFIVRTLNRIHYFVRAANSLCAAKLPYLGARHEII